MNNNWRKKTNEDNMSFKDEVNYNEDNDVEFFVYEQQQEEILEQDKEEEKKYYADINNGKKINKSAKIFSIVAVVLCFVFSSMSPYASRNNKIDLTEEELTTGICNSIEAGQIIILDKENRESRDFTLENEENKDNTTLYIWDYADQDGDYVQLFVDGTPISDVFMMKNTPREFTVPTKSNIQIKGVRDGAGGITYAIKYSLNNKTYLNNAPEGGMNSYKLQ